MEVWRFWDQKTKLRNKKFRINDFTRQIVCVILFDITFQDKSLSSVLINFEIQSALEHWKLHSENVTK